MKFFKSKKGFDYAILLMLVSLICVGFVFWQVNKKEDVFDRSIGDMQIGLALTQQGADNMLLYLDQSAKYAAYDSADLLASQGGYANPSISCGNSIDEGYVSWNACQDPGNICFPDVFSNFNTVFNQVLYSDYLDEYRSSVPGFAFPKNNYLYAVHDKKLTGTALQNIEANTINYQPEGLQHSAGRFAFKPSFSVSFPYNFDAYFRLEDLAGFIVSDCANEFLSFSDIKTCAESYFSQWRVKPVISQSRTFPYILVEFSEPVFMSPYTGSKTAIKFALCMPGLESSP